MISWCNYEGGALGGYDWGNGWVLHRRRLFGYSHRSQRLRVLAGFVVSLVGSLVMKRVDVHQNNLGGQHGFSDLKRSCVGEASNGLHARSITSLTSDIERFQIEIWGK
jgi:hypothetical protein